MRSRRGSFCGAGAPRVKLAEPPQLNDQEEVIMKSVRIGSAANYVKSFAIAIALLGCLVSWSAPQLPSGLAPGQYFVSISDSEEGDANFESSNCSAVNVAQ
jgi:hypothetical protein